MFKDVRAADIIHVVGLFYEYSMYYLLNEWEGRTKKYLAPGQDLRTEAGAQRGLVSHAGLFRGARISSLPTNAFVGRDETRAPLKTPAWEVKRGPASWSNGLLFTLHRAMFTKIVNSLSHEYPFNTLWTSKLKRAKLTKKMIMIYTF